MVTRGVPSWLTCGNRKLVLLAPQLTRMPKVFGGAEYDPEVYDLLLAGMQRLRGSTYLEDGAIQSADLTADGRHISPFDAKAWHVLSVDPSGQVSGCARYLAHASDASFSDLAIDHSALARDPRWGGPLRRAVELDVALARRRGVSYVEVGGWALDKAARCTREVLRIALATYALSRNLGGCIGASTVTVRHCSAAILQKIGGHILEFAGIPMPYYYDPQYRCDMAMLRFESNQPSERYESWIEVLRGQLTAAPVFSKPVIHDEYNASAWQPLAQDMFAFA
jgi:hypothetical protein